MATLILSSVGGAVGNAMGGGLGALLGRTVGAFAGTFLDQKFFGRGTPHEGARLSDLNVQTSTEGAGIPKIYGRMRLAGQVIWATHFEEVVRDEEIEAGGKGATAGAGTVRNYHYFANFAVALCEGPITRIHRAWADGHPFDLDAVTHRIYYGTATQVVDPLIAAHQGEAPAYRGTAYIVFERLPLESFGNRLPQLQFEVIRCVDSLESEIRAITIIPGASEFGYALTAVQRLLNKGISISENRQASLVSTNWTRSIDELMDLCPSLERVALVVTWFGDDLRAALCQIRPQVEGRTRVTEGLSWIVNGVTRSEAQEVTQIEGRPAFGGTPSDLSVREAVQDLKRRGVRVLFYPFMMMDIPADSKKPSPYGEGTQPPYPWRGRITCMPAPGQSGTVDQTSAAAAQVAAFCGKARPKDFLLKKEGVVYSGPREWSYRRFILHYAWLCRWIGGVDGFLLGSELRGLTQIRSAPGVYPFVTALTQLAEDVHGILGPSTQLSYGADWSEYFGHHPQDGSGDVFFHLDPLWAHPRIGFVGIDNYMPLSDWREGRHQDLEKAESLYDSSYLQERIAGGEGYEWYYRSAQDRQEGRRTPIRDTGYDRDWVFRYKDLVGWWRNSHYNRPKGVETSTATAWVPCSKPILFTELGIPAIDKGTNQPNVFFDRKSSESALPHFSRGMRDDFLQRCALEACLRYWRAAVGTEKNPLSPLYGGPMVDPDGVYLWAWDARPWPLFPDSETLWADGENWQTGHWLNGRLGSIGLESLIRALLRDFQIPEEEWSLSQIEGVLDGFIIPAPQNARAALDLLAQSFGFLAVDTGTQIIFRRPAARSTAVLHPDVLVETGEDKPLFEKKRAQESELPHALRLIYADVQQAYASAAVESKRRSGKSRSVQTVSLPIAASASLLRRTAESRLRAIWIARERLRCVLPPHLSHLEPGDCVQFSQGREGQSLYHIETIDRDTTSVIEAVRVEGYLPTPLVRERKLWQKKMGFSAPGSAILEFLDLPVLDSAQPAHAPRVAAFAHPWKGALILWRSVSGQSFHPIQTLEAPATLGNLQTPCTPGRVWQWDEKTSFDVLLYGGSLHSRDPTDVLAGQNTAAVLTKNGTWEILQFAQAVLIAPQTYRLSRLLRGQMGTEESCAVGSEAGAPFVLLNRQCPVLSIAPELLGLELTYRAVPAGLGIDHPFVVTQTFTAQGQGRIPYSPVHLKLQRERSSGALRISWIRRTRIEGDSWEIADVPLGEEKESYELTILDKKNQILRRVTTTEPFFLYGPQQQKEDFGTVSPQKITVTVAQISSSTGHGALRKERFDVEHTPIQTT